MPRKMPKGVNTVQGGRGSNAFPRTASKNTMGAAGVIMSGMEPKVIRKGQNEPILPKGMSSGMMIDES